MSDFAFQHGVIVYKVVKCFVFFNASIRQSVVRFAPPRVSNDKLTIPIFIIFK